jgi:hypothetical protein
MPWRASTGALRALLHSFSRVGCQYGPELDVYVNRDLVFRDAGEPGAAFLGESEDGEVGIGIDRFPDEMLYRVSLEGRRMGSLNVWPKRWRVEAAAGLRG